MKMQIEEACTIIFGRITPMGLMVGDDLYSSPLMIKQRWFENAQITSTWNIPVIVQDSNPEVVFIVSLSVIDQAYRISNVLTPEDQLQLDAYHQQFRELKQQLELIRSKQNVDTD
jgi:hypothetical protein